MIIKRCSRRILKKFTCLWKIHILYSSNKKVVTRIDKNGEGITRFMASSLSNLISNLSEETYDIKCKYRHDNEKCETCGITYEECDCFLE